jgi:hypothetical protein
MALPGRREPSVFDRLDGWVLHTPPQVTKRAPADSERHAPGAWVQPRNGLPPLKPYTWRGDQAGMPETEAEKRIEQARATVTRTKGAPAGLIDCAMPPFAPFTPGPEWYRELDEDGAL